MKAASWVSLFAISPLLLSLPGTSSVRPAAAQPGPNLTRWKFEMATSSSSTGVGVYRRISPRWDLGLVISGSTSSSKDNGDDRYESDTSFQHQTSADDHTYLSFDLSPEFRRWSARTDRLKTFWGLRASVGYGWSDSKQREYQLNSGGLTYQTNRYSDLGHDVGAGLLFGAEWQVSSHLGLGASLRPLSLQYNWSRHDIDRWTEGVGQDQRSVSRTHGFNTDWNLSPSLFAAINF